MFNHHFVFIVSEYEHETMTCAEREGINKVRPYEIGNNKRLNEEE